MNFGKSELRIEFINLLSFGSENGERFRLHSLGSNLDFCRFLALLSRFFALINY